MAYDYRTQAAEWPWSKDLALGDTLNPHQARGICPTRLRDFGLEIRPHGDDFRVYQARPVVTLADLARGD
jgi:hypothetical protein